MYWLNRVTNCIELQGYHKNRRGYEITYMLQNVMRFNRILWACSRIGIDVAIIMGQTNTHINLDGQP